MILSSAIGEVGLALNLRKSDFTPFKSPEFLFIVNHKLTPFG
jgi:hypothetical protein